MRIRKDVKPHTQGRKEAKNRRRNKKNRRRRTGVTTTRTRSKTIIKSMSMSSLWRKQKENLSLGGFNMMKLFPLNPLTDPPIAAIRQSHH